MIPTDPKHGSFICNRLPLPVNPFLSQNSIHAKEKCKLSAIFVTILTIDALPTCPVTAYRDNFLKGQTSRGPPIKIIPRS